MQAQRQGRRTFRSSQETQRHGLPPRAGWADCPQAVRRKIPGA